MGSFVSRLPFRLGLVGVTLLVIQTTWAAEFRVAGTVTPVMVLFAASCGAVTGVERGAVAGFVLGLLHDLVLVGPFGLAAVATGLAGAGGGLLRTKSLMPPWWLAAIVVGAATALGEVSYPILRALVGVEVPVTSRWIHVVVVVAVTGAVIAPVALPVARWTMRTPRPV